MANKGEQESDKSAEQLELERRVDEMMSTKPLPPAPKPAAKPEPKTEKSKTPLKIEIPELKTAPKLPNTKQTEILKEPKIDEPYKLKTPDKPPIVMELQDDMKASVETDTQPAQTTPKPVMAESKSELPDDPLSDGATDKAVDEIVANEGDTLLALDDARIANDADSEPAPSHRGLGLFWLVILLALAVALAVPFTRYKIASVFVRKSLTIVIVDSKTNSPINGAQVRLDKTVVLSDANGQAKLKAGVGQHSLTVAKAYYKNTSTSYFVGFKAAPLPTNIRLEATYRLVPLTIIDKITSKPIPNATIEVATVSGKTDSKGQAIMALPTTSNKAKATISSAGYTTLTADVLITNKSVDQNRFELKPVYSKY